MNVPYQISIYFREFRVITWLKLIVAG